MSKKKKNRSKSLLSQPVRQAWWISPELAERSRQLREEIRECVQGQGLTLVCGGTTPDGNYWSYTIKERPSFNAKVRIYYD